MGKRALIELTLVSSKLVDSFMEVLLGESISLHLEYLLYPTHQSLNIFRVVLSPDFLSGNTWGLGKSTHHDANTVRGFYSAITHVDKVEGGWHAGLDFNAINAVDRSESVLKRHD